METETEKVKLELTHTQKRLDLRRSEPEHKLGRGKHTGGGLVGGIVQSMPRRA